MKIDVRYSYPPSRLTGLANSIPNKDKDIARQYPTTGRGGIRRVGDFVNKLLVGDVSDPSDVLSALPDNVAKTTKDLALLLLITELLEDHDIEYMSDRLLAQELKHYQSSGGDVRPLLSKPSDNVPLSVDFKPLKDKYYYCVGYRANAFTIAINRVLPESPNYRSDIELGVFPTLDLLVSDIIDTANSVGNNSVVQQSQSADFLKVHGGFAFEDTYAVLQIGVGAKLTHSSQLLSKIEAQYIYGKLLLNYLELLAQKVGSVNISFDTTVSKFTEDDESCYIDTLVDHDGIFINKQKQQHGDSLITFYDIHIQEDLMSTVGEMRRSKNMDLDSIVKALANDATTTQTLILLNVLVQKARKSIYSALINDYREMKKHLGKLAVKSHRRGMYLRLLGDNNSVVINLNQLESTLKEISKSSIYLRLLTLLSESYILSPDGFTRDFIALKMHKGNSRLKAIANDAYTLFERMRIISVYSSMENLGFCWTTVSLCK